MGWDARAPVAWRVATLKSLVGWAFVISSAQRALKEEIGHLEEVFVECNNYPIGLIESIVGEESGEDTDEERVVFLGIGSLVFSDFLHEVKGQ